MAKGYFKLKDTGTTFYNIETGEGVVADKTELLTISARVSQAVNSGTLIQVSRAEGEAAVAKQTNDAKTEVAAKKAAKKATAVKVLNDTDDESTDDADDEDAVDDATADDTAPKKAVAPKKSVTPPADK